MFYNLIFKRNVYKLMKLPLFFIIFSLIVLIDLTRFNSSQKIYMYVYDEK